MQLVVTYLSSSLQHSSSTHGISLHSQEPGHRLSGCSLISQPCAGLVATRRRRHCRPSSARGRVPIQCYQTSSGTASQEGSRSYVTSATRDRQAASQKEVSSYSCMQMKKATKIPLMNIGKMISQLASLCHLHILHQEQTMPQKQARTVCHTAHVTILSVLDPHILNALPTLMPKMLLQAYSCLVLLHCLPHY